jgi:uncharacterized protein YjbI with pentapeptide repeats
MTVSQETTTRQVPWETCTLGDCIGVQLPNAESCFAHASGAIRERALDKLSRGGDLDFTKGVRISRVRLNEILDAAPLEDGHPVLINADFTRAQLEPEADFRGALFKGYTTFRGAVFLGQPDNDVPFEELINNRSAYEDWLDFGHTQFHGKAVFTGAEFQGKVSFTDARFYGQPEKEQIFEGGADFQSATFKGRAHFGGAQFKSSVFFRQAVFEGLHYLC